MESAYFLTCLRYIELNPVRAGMVGDPSEYTWSSYGANAFGIQCRLWRPHPQYLALGQTDKERQSRYRAMFTNKVEDDLVTNIRDCVNRGIALGSDKFRRQIEELGGRRQYLMKRGPKSK